MIYRIIHWWARVFLRLYFRKTIVYGLEHVPRKGPLIVASNHPSAFLEASVLATVLSRPLHFLVRGDMFHPKFRWLFNWTNQIPIYRQKDGISNLRKNASSFDLTYRKLAEGEAVLIFPEAKTILEKKMRPIQRGTAHLAFGTLPFMTEDQILPVIPVGVNFTEPRIPGTDVVIRFEKPFLTELATREDRDAIERFTETLSDAMSPLIVQIEDHGYEHHYEVLSSVYFGFLYAKKSRPSAHADLIKISSAVNHHEAHKFLIEKVHEFIHTLKHNKIVEAAYFPRLLTFGRIRIAGLLLLKMVWWLAGGWIWRSARAFIFKKIKTITFQGPTSLGAAMVIIPLVALLMLITCLVAGLPAWYVAVWLFVMWMGTFFRPPLGLIWKVLVLKPEIRKRLGKDVRSFTEEIVTILK